MNAVARTSRRGFLGSAIGSAMLAGGGLQVQRGPALAQPASRAVNAWVTLSAGGEVVIRFASTEMGQGVNTSLPMILAEEMDADWSRVHVEQLDAGPVATFGNPATGGILFTAGSSSVEGYFAILRRAGADARRILVHSAARAWRVRPEEVTTEAGLLLHPPSGRRMDYGAVTALPEIVTDVPAVTDADLKPAPPGASSARIRAGATSPRRRVARRRTPSMSACPACSTPH
jgi:isoquinoline 1-oxidoreductase beta subunit